MKYTCGLLCEISKNQLLFLSEGNLMFSVHFHLPHLEQFIPEGRKGLCVNPTHGHFGWLLNAENKSLVSPLKMIPFLWIPKVKMPESPRYFSARVTFFPQKEFFQPAAYFCFPLCKSVPCDQRYVIVLKTSVSQRVRCCNLGTVAVCLRPHPGWPGQVSNQCVFTDGQCLGVAWSLEEHRRVGFCPQASCNSRLRKSGGFTLGTKHLISGIYPGEKGMRSKVLIT